MLISTLSANEIQKWFSASRSMMESFRMPPDILTAIDAAVAKAGAVLEMLELLMGLVRSAPSG